MKKTLRSAMLSTIAMLVVAVLSLTGVTYAWFSQSTTAKVDGMTMEVGTAGAGLQVAKAASEGAEKTWGSAITFTVPDDKELQPVSTTDTAKFYNASVSVDNDDTIISISEDTTLANVWKETFYLRNSGNGNLSVKFDATPIFTDNSEDESYKAARIAIFEGDTASVDKLVAIYGDHDNTTYLALKGLIPSGSTTVSASTESSAVAAVSNKFVNNSANIPNLTAPGRDETTNETKEQAYTVMVWLEGQDPQCDNDAALSSFKVALNFEVAQ